MARQESDREDLLRDATAFVQRIELQIADVAEPVFVGFRRDGAVSFYFGSEPVYQFNAQHQLRRAYVDQLLVKAEEGSLATLDRRRSGGEVELVRHDLNSQETSKLMDRMQDRLKHLDKQLAAGTFTTNGQIPEDADLVVRIRDWLKLREKIEIAASPRVS